MCPYAYSDHFPRARLWISHLDVLPTAPCLLIAQPPYQTGAQEKQQVDRHSVHLSAACMEGQGWGGGVEGGGGACESLIHGSQPSARGNEQEQAWRASTETGVLPRTCPGLTWAKQLQRQVFRHLQWGCISL